MWTDVFAELKELRGGDDVAISVDARFIAGERRHAFMYWSVRTL